jgi:ATP-dependent Clp protease adaptor protein ClpS
MWHVVLLDDDDHTYEYVIRMMQELFGHSPEKAFKVAKTVDEQGRVVCMTTHKEHAELKQEQVHGYGADPLMARSKGAMSAVLEPADFEGDEENSGNTGGGRGTKP